jgi:acetylornithine/succinyldiaminopimelate/putrescine aminotransferase
MRFPLPFYGASRYLDCVNNVAHVGHSHPRILEAAARQLTEINTNTRYLHPGRSRYAKRLLDTLPAELDTVREGKGRGEGSKEERVHVRGGEGRGGRGVHG